MENAAYFENSLNQDQNQTAKQDQAEPEEVVIDDISIYEEKSQDSQDTDFSNSDTKTDEISPQLFSDEETSTTSSEDKNDDLLKEEEDFEIPAFLRKQKF